MKVNNYSKIAPILKVCIVIALHGVSYFRLCHPAIQKGHLELHLLREHVIANWSLCFALYTDLTLGPSQIFHATRLLTICSFDPQYNCPSSIIPLFAQSIITLFVDFVLVSCSG